MEAGRIIDAYRWQRGLGNRVIQLPHGRIVSNADHPDIWDANHADAVTAARPDEIAALLAEMDRHLAHSAWRVVHSDPDTPAPFVARLALDGYVEQLATIQMVLEGRLAVAPRGDIVPIADAAGWRALAELVRRDHEEGGRTGGVRLSSAQTDAVLAGYRAKDGPYRFHLVYLDGRAVAYGALAAAPSGAGMIEDLFTLAAYRGRGIASALIAHFAALLEAQGCSCVFLGALMGEPARHLYAKLGFRPVMVTRCWVRRAG
ncbi:MAG: hypothetical protein ABS87_11535 [Sphingomonas sp. SCN 67-18]|uniref:GNAT family N-acetyltransferase n=1 Tax=uncultured Sphingomonas sp. TaxID=158754 RepID=UPI00086E3C9E|nr:GNAT family N-acetyltransferase [Sphingomonas sp. SCN 67-18]ODU20273.1 MAG: hypothetical protein ABS87_11535 [Sphingomonas sp. SCN 67-18]